MIVFMENHRPTCSVSGCASPAYTLASGLCVMHYARVKKHGSTDDPGRNKRLRRSHPLWLRWFQLKRRDVLCPEWASDFWAFVEGVSPQPENTKRLGRIRDEEPFGPTNFRWMVTPSKEESLAYVRQWQHDNRERVKDSKFRRAYGIGWADYERMLAEQNGGCAICGQFKARFTGKQSKSPGYLCVDHDHETGEVRGLLCSDCNVALGAFKDNPTTILRAIGYLRQHARSRLRVVE